MKSDISMQLYNETIALIFIFTAHTFTLIRFKIFFSIIKQNMTERAHDSLI